MADETTSEDRTEEPTARRIQKAREDGETAKSNEVTAAAVMIVVAVYFQIYGGITATRITETFGSGFVFDQKILNSAINLPAIFAEQIWNGYVAVLPVLAITLLAAVVASGFTGGYLFSIKATAPNLRKLNILSGLQRMFGIRALVELGKTILKFLLVVLALTWIMNENLLALIQLGSMSIEPALAEAATLIVRSILLVTLSFVAIGFLDSVYQRHSFAKRMRMTKQEIRDEMKDIEGRPEVRARIRRRQREMATSRMIERVKDADVVITNPEHFAVALAYDPTRNGAPTLIAKGVDSIAFGIIEAAKKSGVHTFPAPPLARALYFTTKIDHPIHEDLYFAVAQVIAYVFGLNSFQPGQGKIRRPHVEVPASVRFDRDGRLESGTE